MKIFHIINTLSAGGAEVHLLTLCRYLKRRGVELVVACLREKVKGSRSLRADFEKENVRIFDLGADSRYNFAFLSRLAFLVKQQRPDILHTHLPRADLAGALISGFVKSPTFICSVHGIYRDRWFGSWAAPFMRWGYRNAAGVIAISSAVETWLQQELGVCGDNVRVIHYGIEPERFAVDKDGSTEKQSGRIVIGSIGRLEPGKGFDCLIRAMEIVRKQTPDAALLIAGHDPLGYGKTLEALIAQLALSEHVQLIGFQRDVPKFLNGMDVFAFASKSEGFGQVVIEAMAAAKPVVVSDIAPLTDIVIDGKTGRVAKCGDPQSFASAIGSLLSDPDLATQMGRRGRQRVYDQFSAQKMADETLDLYECLLKSPREEVAHAL